MKTTRNIQHGYSSAEAADMLEVTVWEISRLVRSGQLEAAKLPGGALLIDPSSLQTYKLTKRGKGRPWAPTTAWAALWLLSGLPVDWLTYHQKRRLNIALSSIDAENLVWMTRRRLDTQHYRAMPSFAATLKSKLVATGVNVQLPQDVNLTGQDTQLDGYIEADSLETAKKELFLKFDPQGNITIRLAYNLPIALSKLEQMPNAVVAADLAMSLDPRERRVGLTYLEGALREYSQD